MICIIKPSDFDEFERLNMALVKATKRDRWQAWAALLRYIEGHPTLIPHCCARAREAWEELPEFRRKEPANVN